MTTEATAQNTSTFETDPNISWYRSQIDKEVLAGLMERDNLRGWLQTVSHLGLFFTTALMTYQVFATITIANWYWSVPLLVLALFVHGTMGPFMGLIAIHELQHRTVFKSKAQNVFFEKIYAFISWSDYIWYQQSHARHHMTTCHERYDGEVQLPLKFSLSRKSVWLGLLGWNPKLTWGRLNLVWRHANGRVEGAWYRHVLPESESGLRRRHRNWARLLLVGHFLLAFVFIVTGHWFLIVVFTFGTYYCSWLGFLCGVTQHFGLNANVTDFRLNSRTFTCGKLPAFYYWNMQYHVEHHMFPGVPFYNLPKLREAILHDLPPAPHGLVATWRELLTVRAKLIEDPHYRFIPEIPSAVNKPQSAV